MLLASIYDEYFYETRKREQHGRAGFKTELQFVTSATMMKIANLHVANQENVSGSSQ
jgi:hypothetical protein